MAIQKQNISIPLGLGIDTKTDPNQVNPGALLNLTNATKRLGQALQKRNGYFSLTGNNLAASSSSFPGNLTTFNNELVTLQYDNPQAQILSLTNTFQANTAINGSYVPVEVSVSSVVRAFTSNQNPDSAYNPNTNILMHAWADQAQQLHVSFSEINGKTLASYALSVPYNPNISSNQVFPFRTANLGNYFILVVSAVVPQSVRYYAWNESLQPIGDSVNGNPISLQISAPGYLDADVANNRLYISWDADGTGGIRYTYLDNNLNIGPIKLASGFAANNAIQVFADNAIQPAQIWTCFASSTQAYYFVNDSNLNSVLPVTTINATSGNVAAMIGFASSGVGIIYSQIQNTYGTNSLANFTSVRSDFIAATPVSNTGSLGVGKVWNRGMSIASKVFYNNRIPYFVSGYGSPNGQNLEPTYFLMRATSAYPVARIAQGNAGTFGWLGHVSTANVNTLGNNKFQTDYMLQDVLVTFADQIVATTGSGTPVAATYSQVGINSAIFDFNSKNLPQSQEIGSNLNITGGFLSCYDGNMVYPNNFHVFPEDVYISSSTVTAPSPSSGLLSGTYNYSTFYQWMDKQGNIINSSPSTPVSFTVGTGTTAQVQVNVPTYRFKTGQSNINVVVSRTAPSIDISTFYQVTPVSNPIASTGSVDTVTFIDYARDTSIIGNPVLYTAGGVLPNTGVPPCFSPTIFDSRLWVIGTEDKLQRFYSKEVQEGTSVEMSDLLTLTADPRFGNATALSTMDDKLITFKNNAIFYLTGTGPDLTGSNSQYSPDIFITSQLGCTNPKSLVLMQDGLMFQSNKGIWLLARDLSVNYIGAPVEAYNSYDITSAIVVPNTTEVRFTLTNGTALVWDYYYKQWSIFNNINAAGATVYQGVFTYLSRNQQVYLLQETPGIYSDNGVPVLMGLQTAFLSLGGFQGFERIYSFFLKAQYISPHVLSVSFAYDYNPNVVQQVNIPVSDLFNNKNYGSDPLYGAGAIYGGVYPNEQYEIGTSRQKCQSVQVTIQEQIDTSNVVLGAGPILEAIGALIGVKSDYPRLSPAQKVT